MEVTLTSCSVGSVVCVKHLNVTGQEKRRLLDLGFIPGAYIHILQRSPLGDPTAYRVSSTTIALRKEESDHIIVEEVTNG